MITYFSFNSFTYVDEDFIRIGKGFKTLQYTWDEMDELYYNGDGDVNWYEIVTITSKDAQVITKDKKWKDNQNNYE